MSERTAPPPPPEPLDAAVTRPLASMVALRLVYVPAGLGLRFSSWAPVTARLAIIAVAIPPVATERVTFADSAPPPVRPEPAVTVREVGT